MKFSLPVMAVFLAAQLLTTICRGGSIEDDWKTPPPSARLKAYWWWLNGNVTHEAIERDLTEMKAKGFGGSVLFDAGGAEQRGNAQVPHGATFLSPEWRELFHFTLETAHRLDLEISLNLQSGWNLGGPMVSAGDAPKKLTWSQTQADGGMTLKLTLPKPPTNEGYYRDLRVLAYPLKAAAMDAKRKPLDHWREKALLDALHFSAPDTSSLVAADDSKQPPDALTSEVIDITDKMKPDGSIEWTAPTGRWEILRMGVTLNDHCHISTSSEGWSGYAIDPFDDGAFRRYWDAVVEPLLADAKPYEGKTLKYLHTDSWEVEVANWTPSLREEFRTRRGYDLLPWLPVISGRILDGRDASNRFLDDLRRTMGDLAIDHHYRLMKEGAQRHGLLIHPESGGPHAVPIDAQQCLGFNDAPMSEFWAWSWTHRIGNANRYFVKQPAMAAHTYGRNLVMAEGFTTIGPHWQERLCDNLKPSFDHACTEGLNQLVWHAFVCSPASEGIPGQQYFAGSHLNPNVTWWEKSGAFFSYINRCQALLQRGLPVSDIAYYYGHHVPNFAQLRESDPAKAGPGYDYDVVTEEVLTQNMYVENGRLILPHGVSYAALVLPPQPAISIQALRKIQKLAAAGALIIGPAPENAAGLDDSHQEDLEVADIRRKLWSKNPSQSLIKDQPTREALLKRGISADVEFQGDAVDWVHRRENKTEIYFLANPQAKAISTTASFRVKGMTAELWDPVTARIPFASV
jgi:alpha-L-rhamnosidase